MSEKSSFFFDSLVIVAGCRFNFVHSSIRMVVERAFSMLKMKWRILISWLEYLDMAMIERVILVLRSA